MIGQLTELIKNIDEKVIAYGSQELLKGPLCFSQVGLLFVLMIRYIVHDPYLTQPVEIQKWTLPLNFGMHCAVWGHVDFHGLYLRRGNLNCM